MSEKRVIEFNALPKESRERFVAVCNKQGEPPPIHEETTAPAAAVFGWVVVLALGLGLVGAVAAASFGELYNGIDGYGYIILYVLGAVLALGGLLAAIRAIVAAGAIPYRLGTYLFPLDLVIAVDDKLSIMPLSGLTNVNGVHHHTNGSYTHTELTLSFAHGQHVLRIHGQPLAEQVLAEMRAGQGRVMEALQRGDTSIFAQLDPFYAARSGGEWDRFSGERNVKPKDGPVARRLPAILSRAWLIGLIASLLLGPGLWYVRNMLSDDAMFAIVEQAGNVDMCQTYLYNGGTRHREEVEGVLLPKFAFEDAKAIGSVTALREFRTEYPGSAHDEDAKQAIHDLFERALVAFKATHGGEEDEVVAFMTTLMTWLEVNDSPPVEVRFLPPDPSLLKETDELIAGLPMSETGGVPVAQVSPSFDDQRSSARESYILAELQAGFSQVIPNDILQLQMTTRLAEDTDLSTLSVERATIAVAYDIGASGSIYTNELNTQGYVGIEVLFLVVMKIPGEDQPLSFVVDVQPPSSFTVETTGIAIQPSDFLVYDIMAKKAFENLATRLGAALFSSDGGAEAILGEVPELDLDAILGEEG